MVVIEQIKAFERELVAIRHDLHAHPELGFEETRTAALISNKLKEWGIETHEGIARTGVVGVIRGSRAGNRSIGLRADMDALAIEEKTGLPYASTIPGKMHACGHDGHMAMLLGAGRFLAQNRDFAGTVYLIFQPAEEGLGGGRQMIEDGLFERFPIDAVYGMHNDASHPVGQFATRAGAMLAASDTWSVRFHGTGGHGGAGVHLATDPTIPMAHFILACQSIIGRNIPALEAAVISVGHVSAGAVEAPNIIPAEVLVKGTARSYSGEVRDRIEQRLRETATRIAEASNCTAELIYERRYPPLINDIEKTRTAVLAATAVVGAQNVEANMQPVTASEDFSFMLQERPGAMIMIGNKGKTDETAHFVHTPMYNFNDEIIPTGVAYWITLANEELK